MRVNYDNGYYSDFYILLKVKRCNPWLMFLGKKGLLACNIGSYAHVTARKDYYIFFYNQINYLSKYHNI